MADDRTPTRLTRREAIKNIVQAIMDIVWSASINARRKRIPKTEDIHVKTVNTGLTEEF